VAYAYNRSYSGSRDQEDHSSKPAQANSSQERILKKRGEGWWSDSRCRPLVQAPVLQKKKKKRTEIHAHVSLPVSLPGVAFGVTTHADIQEKCSVHNAKKALARKHIRLERDYKCFLSQCYHFITEDTEDQRRAVTVAYPRSHH
jgi:hypothetical protein